MSRRELPHFTGTGAYTLTTQLCQCTPLPFIFSCLRHIEFWFQHLGSLDGLLLEKRLENTSQFPTSRTFVYRKPRARGHFWAGSYCKRCQQELELIYRWFLIASFTASILRVKPASVVPLGTSVEDWSFEH